MPYPKNRSETAETSSHLEVNTTWVKPSPIEELYLCRRETQPKRQFSTPPLPAHAASANFLPRLFFVGKSLVFERSKSLSPPTTIVYHPYNQPSLETPLKYTTDSNRHYEAWYPPSLSTLRTPHRSPLTSLQSAKVWCVGYPLLLNNAVFLYPYPVQRKCYQLRPRFSILNRSVRKHSSHPPLLAPSLGEAKTYKKKSHILGHLSSLRFPSISRLIPHQSEIAVSPHHTSPRCYCVCMVTLKEESPQIIGRCPHSPNTVSTWRGCTIPGKKG